MKIGCLGLDKISNWLPGRYDSTLNQSWNWLYHFTVELLFSLLSCICPITLTPLIDQWRLRKLLGIKWYHHVWNNEVRRTTGQPRLSAIVQAWRLYLFSNIAQMSDETDAKKIYQLSPWKIGGDHQDALVLRG